MNMSTDEGQSGGQAMMMPFFMGGPWVSKFSGAQSDIKFGEWKSQIETMLTFQPIRETQKADFILGLLDGDARREILTLDRSERNTPKKIFDALFALYGDNTHVSTLRTQFYNCRQEPNQSLRAFSLKLRELFSRLKQKDTIDADQGNLVLRDQFIMGLKEGPIRQELRRQVRKRPELTFEEVKTEALALEDERGESWPPYDCAAVSRAPPSPRVVADWKEQLRAEIMNDVKAQMSVMTKTILEEIRNTASPPLEAPRHPGRSPRPNTPRNYSNFKWDPQGRPICSLCEQIGHISRRCPSKQSAQDF